MKKLRGTLEFKLQKKDKEIPTGISLTVPDDSYTIQELLQKHEQGLALGIQRLAQYDIADDEEFDGIDMHKYQQLEEFEKREMIEKTAEITQRYKAGKQRLDAEKREKASATKVKTSDAD